MNSTVTSAPQSQSVQLKGSLLPLTVLELSFFEPSQFSAELQAKSEQAPDFFKNLPVVIGLTKFDGSKGPADFERIIRICSTFSIRPVAVRGGSETQQIAARLAGLATFPAQKDKIAATEPEQQNTADDNTSEATAESLESTPAATEPSQQSEPSKQSDPSKQSETAETTTPAEAQSATEDTPNAVEAKPQETRIIYQPVRSGQQVYAQNGDLIVLAQVSAGAEILADGNIHVYGPLRGRALAGVKGNTQARIFCHSLEAELVSIAGQYKISEDLQNESWKKPSQVHLSDETLTVKALVD